MRKFLIGFAVIFFLLVSAIVALPFLIPASTYRDVIESRLEAALGRDVIFEKDPKISFFPQIGVSFDGVTIANAKGFDAPYFAKADSMSVAVKWMPLLSKRVEIASANFKGTEVFLEEKKTGETNWVFDPENSSPKSEAETPETSAKKDAGFDALIPKARLSDSRVKYTSVAAGVSYDVTNIDLTASLSGLKGPVGLKGSFSVNEEPIQIDATLTSLDQLMSGETFTVAADVRSDLAKVNYEGRFTLGDAIAMQGNFSGEVDNLDKLTRFAAIQTEQDLSALGKISLSGQISGEPENLALTGLNMQQQSKLLTSTFTGDIKIGKSIVPTGDVSAKSGNVRDLAKAFGVELEGSDSAFRTLDVGLTLTPSEKGTKALIKTFAFDDITATGSTSFDLSGKTPYIKADLAFPALDLTPYIPESDTGQKTGDPTDGWSTDPVDLSALKLVNGDINVTVGSLSNDRAEILDVVLTSRLRDGSLSGKLLSEAPDSGRTGTSKLLNPLYTGSLETNFVLATQNDKSNRLSFSADGSGIAASDLLKFFTGQDVLRGVASLKTSAKTSGYSISDFVQNLSGTYEANVLDGALFNINLAQMIRTATSALSAKQLPSALSPEEETDFSSLNLQGGIVSGTANIEVFRLLSPILKAESTGSIDLFNQTLDIRIVPRAVAMDTQKLAGVEIGQIGIPVKVQGSWFSPSVSLDTDYYAKLVADEAKSRLGAEIENRLGDELGGDLGGILGQALGGSSSKSDDTDQSESSTSKKDQKKEPEDLIKGLIFGD